MSSTPTGWNPTARNGLLVFAALFLAVAGIAMAARDDDEDSSGVCDRGPQRWEDIYTLQENPDQEEQIIEELLEAGCLELPTTTIYGSDDDVDELRPEVVVPEISS